MPTTFTPRPLLATVAGTFALALAGTATAHAPIDSRFPAAGAERKVVRTVRITFDAPVLTGSISVKHNGVLVTPFTTGIVARGKALQATFPDGLPRGRVSVSWVVTGGDRHRRKGGWRFRVTTGDSSHGHG